MRTALVTSAALHDIVATISAHVDACLEFTTSELRPVVLAMLEERHPQVLEVDFTASIGDHPQSTKKYQQQSRVHQEISTTIQPSRVHQESKVVIQKHPGFTNGIPEASIHEEQR